MEFTNAQIRDFAGSDEQYEKAKRLVDEQRIVSLDIDDFSSREIIMINATIKDGKNYREVNMLSLIHICNGHRRFLCGFHIQNYGIK